MGAWPSPSHRDYVFYQSFRCRRIAHPLISNWCSSILGIHPCLGRRHKTWNHPTCYCNAQRHIADVFIMWHGLCIFTVRNKKWISTARNCLSPWKISPSGCSNSTLFIFMQLKASSRNLRAQILQLWWNFNAKTEKWSCQVICDSD